MFQQIDWSKLSRLDYWFEGIAGDTSISPPVEYKSEFFWYYLWIFTLVFSTGVVFRLIQSFLHKDHPLQSKLELWGNNIIWIGVLGALWFILRQLSVGFLGSRFWLLVFVIWVVVLAGFAIRYFLKYFSIEYLYFKNVSKVK